MKANDGSERGDTNDFKEEERVMKAMLEMPAPVTPPEAATAAQSKLLLADDDPAIRQILHRLLHEEGYLVLTAANGVEALELDRATKLDLVLLDLNMPLKDGWETFRQLTMRHPLLPIILITARSNQFFPALASGVGALMEKPLDFVRLFQTIRQLLAEPVEARLARHRGRPALFSYIPPIPGRPGSRTA
jgi:CheY-like chemotaxis protein